MTVDSALQVLDPDTRYEQFRSELLAAGLLYDTGAAGVYGYSAEYQSVVAALDRAITALGGGIFQSVTFPPVLARPTFDRTDYLHSFPDLMGEEPLESPVPPRAEHDGVGAPLGGDRHESPRYLPI